MNFHLPVAVAHNHARLISRICHICTHIHITCATTSNDAHDVDRGKRSYSFYPDDVNELSELPALIPKAEHFSDLWTAMLIDLPRCFPCAFLVEIRARQRTFDGAYGRSALGTLGYALTVLRLFDRRFFKSKSRHSRAPHRAPPRSHLINPARTVYHSGIQSGSSTPSSRARSLCSRTSASDMGGTTSRTAGARTRRTPACAGSGPSRRSGRRASGYLDGRSERPGGSSLRLRSSLRL